MIRYQDPTTEKMEAIAGGVQARLEESTGFSQRVTSETVEIARALGVGDREIERWVNRRQELLAPEEARIGRLRKRLAANGQP